MGINGMSEKRVMILGKNARKMRNEIPDARMFVEILVNPNHKKRRIT
jgi:hypothetical protein